MKCFSNLPRGLFGEREIIVSLMMLKCTLESKTVFLISLCDWLMVLSMSSF